VKFKRVQTIFLYISIILSFFNLFCWFKKRFVYLLWTFWNWRVKHISNQTSFLKFNRLNFFLFKIYSIYSLWLNAWGRFFMDWSRNLTQNKFVFFFVFNLFCFKSYLILNDFDSVILPLSSKQKDFNCCNYLQFYYFHL